MSELNLTPKQAQAYLYLTHPKFNYIKELGYGGGAGGGKSILGCAWELQMCSDFPGVAYAIGRKELSTLKKTTLLSLFQVASICGLKPGIDFKYNAQSNIINFPNGSKIFLVDMANQPSDPLYTRFGGLELTGAFVDESNENNEKAIEILKTRLGRCLNKEYCPCGHRTKDSKVLETNSNGIAIKWKCGGCGEITTGLTPKLLETFNPDKGHVYRVYYKPWKDNTLPKNKAFIPALATDNPHLPEDYIEQLRNADKITKERLLYGNFDYDDNPAKLFEYDKILDIFSNKFVDKPRQEKYCTCDVARKGRDKTVIMIWRGLFIETIYTEDISDVYDVADKLEEMCIKYKVPSSNLIIDEDGVGGGVVDILKRKYPQVKGFINNSSPKETKGSKKIHNYSNLKAQCYFKLAELVQINEVGCCDVSVDYKELMIADLEQIAQKDIDKDGPIRLIGKDEMKEKLGRSTDFSDAMMMRMYFEVTVAYRPYIARR